MAYPDHLLSRGERVVLHKHPHWKVLVLPVVWLVLTIGLASFGAAWAKSHTGNYPIWWIAIAVVGVLLLVFLTVVPFVRWRTEHFVITTRHVFFRTGFFKRREHQIPLNRIQNLETNVTFWGRLLGFGTLTVESAADEPLSFFNVASLPKVQGELNQLIDDDRSGGGLGDAPPRYDPPPHYDPPPSGNHGADLPDLPADDTSTRRIAQQPGTRPDNR